MAEKMIISLVPVFDNPKTRRSNRAIRKIRNDVAKRFHFRPEAVVLSPKVNSAVFCPGIQKIPRKVSLMLEKDQALIRVYLEGEKIPKKEDKEKEKKAEQKKEAKQETEEEREIERKKQEKREMEKAAEKAAFKHKDRV